MENGEHKKAVAVPDAYFTESVIRLALMNFEIELQRRAFEGERQLELEFDFDRRDNP